MSKLVSLRGCYAAIMLDFLDKMLSHRISFRVLQLKVPKLADLLLYSSKTLGDDLLSFSSLFCFRLSCLCLQF